MDEGGFVASYKFALLHAIADLCLVKGDVGGAKLELSTSEIAEQFIRLYWPQVVPYSASAEQPILSQNHAVELARSPRRLRRSGAREAPSRAGYSPHGRCRRVRAAVRRDTRKGVSGARGGSHPALQARATALFRG